MIERKKKLCKCGCGREGYIWSRGMLKDCYYKLNPPKPIKAHRNATKFKEQVEAGQTYYKKKIGLNIIANKGVCRCDECGQKILHPTGRNVCHILSFKRCPEAYDDIDNSFVLGKGFGECECGSKFDDSAKKSKMSIYRVYLQRKSDLKAKYLAKN